jgi:regulator of cell morphogenesis and NO signaling
MTIEATYNKQMKVADLIAADNNLLSILHRLDIHLGFGEATIQEICTRYNISTSLFLEICNIYSFRHHQPNIHALVQKDIKNITTYLRASHKYYTEVCFPTIHEGIHRLVKELDDVNRRLIDKFYDDYDNEVTSHFRYEEETVFPYIETLLNGNKSKSAEEQYNISKFEENHSNISEKLNDLKNIIIKYLPEEHSSALRFEILNNIFAVENDLRKHSQIENKLLIPLVEIMEKHNAQP